MLDSNQPLVKFTQAYSYDNVYISPNYVASVSRHAVWSNRWTNITISGNTVYIVLEPIESVLEKLGIV
jgi:hypothetical protein